MVASKPERASKFKQTIAGNLTSIGLIILILNFVYAHYNKVNISPIAVLFFVISLVYYLNISKKNQQVESTNLIGNIGSRGEGILKSNLRNDETIIAKLKGAFGEAFVVTDRNIYILKWGYMTGQFFGGRCNCYPFQRIIGIEFKNGITTGVIEVLTAANQNRNNMSYWGAGANNATQSDNAVSFISSEYNKFQEAVNQARKMITDEGTNGNKSDFSQLEKLSELKEKGIINAEEFNAKKKMILGL